MTAVTPAPGATAQFSPCRTYRYTLLRSWDHRRQMAMFIGLNPSTADETTDDPTIRRCMRFARDWGYGGLIMLNLYGYRSTNPRGLLDPVDPVGPDNDDWMQRMRTHAGIAVAAWGANPGPVAGRIERVAALLGELHVLGLTKDGSPRHPLYMRADSQPQAWSAA